MTLNSCDPTLRTMRLSVGWGTQFMDKADGAPGFGERNDDDDDGD